MKIRIDTTRCIGCGLCEESLPELFSIGEFTASVSTPYVPTEWETDVRDIAEDCPTDAIIIDEHLADSAS
jgi:ferredoxin